MGLLQSYFTLTILTPFINLLTNDKSVFEIIMTGKGA